MTEIDPRLAALAEAYGVATWYDDWAQRRVEVASETVLRVLGLLGVDASDPEAALAAREKAARDRLVPPTIVATPGRPPRLPAGVSARVLREDGGEQDGVDDLPLGWHRLEVSSDGRVDSAILVVAPDRLDLPARRGWGWMVQLYSVRSEHSWGMGDYADLAELARWSGAEQGADVLLCNPLHAESPVHPVQPSPYYPGSRRFRSPLYLRVEQLPEYAAADPDIRARVDALRPPPGGDRIDRDVVWAAKRAALELLFPLVRRDALAAYRAEQGAGLADFALFGALAERYGVPWQDWPVELRRPTGAAVEQARAELADRVDFHAWLQLCCDEQLAGAATAAHEAGMAIGVVHDLAVGVDPGGADGWALQDQLALGATVGAPPDSFNQQGQDWGLPPWQPDALAAAGYAPYRDMVRGVLRHAGGLRVDHVLGLFRLWWVPEGESAVRGTYVRYDADALLGVLALEAHRARAVVIGEDLGTVAPQVTRTLAERGVLGSAVLWFEQEDGAFVAPERWRPLAAASVSTHDLPTAAGWLAGEHVRVRAELGLLGHSREEEERRGTAEREALLAMLHEQRLLGPEPSPAEVVLALHATLLRAPCRLVLAALGDAIGDLRQPNLPGTIDQYPNWRLPLADAAGRPHSLEDLWFADVAAADAVRRLVRLLDTGLLDTGLRAPGADQSEPGSTEPGSTEPAEPAAG